MKKIYVCGPTVYSKVHIGNMKPAITFDIFLRSLKYLGEKVKYVNNITDIDDKIIKKAKEENISELEVSQKYYLHYIDMLKTFNVEKPDAMPLVTENIQQIIIFIKKLVDSKHAYESAGNVYFDVKSIKTYGEISNNKLEDLKSEKDLNKKNSADFAIWKNTSEGIQFDSPWGKGRPGWHTECVYFIDEIFNNQVDIHGGGIDLIFPHHENENVQFRALYDKPIAKQFIHTGLFNFQGEKMAKSIGNILNADDFANKYGQDTLRTIVLSSSITAPVNLNEKIIELNQKITDKFSKLFTKILLTHREINFAPGKNKEIAKLFSKWKFAEAMKNVNEKIKKFNKSKQLKEHAEEIVEMFTLMGYSFTLKQISDKDIEMFEKWNKAREEGDFEASDKLRDQLLEKELI